MRLLHTSDWHLGRSFHQVGLLDAQAAFLDHLVEVVRAERVTAVLVSGDIYDRAMPSPDAVAVLSEGVLRLRDAGAHVVLTGGNHDSATRLGFGAALLERAGLHIRTSPADIGRPVVIDDVAVHALPYLEPAVAAGPLEAESRTHAGVLVAAMERVRAALATAPVRRSVVMAHAFVAGGAPSDSERDIAVGGVSAVAPEVFAGVDYVALGHLHRPQAVSETVRYCGSPLAMSFGEHAQVKGSLLVDLSGGTPIVEPVAGPVPRPVAVLRGDLDDLLRDASLTHAESAWCQVTLTDAARPVGAMERIRARFPHTLELRFDPQGVVSTLHTYAARVGSRDVLDVCVDFLGHVRAGALATDLERALMAEALESARLSRGAKDDEGLLPRSRSTGAA